MTGDVPERLHLVPVQSLNSDVEFWYDYKFGDLVLAKITCWSEPPDALLWDICWPGPDSYRVDNAPQFTDHESAARWFYHHHIKELA